ncbi:MAG: hypothetical protein WEB04_04470, partial [Dehalococcoidia bacterium]
MRTATLLWLLVAAIVLTGLVALSAGLAREARAGAVAKLTVNSTANNDDGDCSGAPNAGSGDCTLREAINDVNDGLADEINFHPAVFSQAAHGVIQLDLGLGPLPPILRQVKIDAKGVGVVLDGDFDNDGIGVPWGIMVIASHNGFDFELNGGGNTFIIQDVGCDLSQLNSVSGPGDCIRGSGGQSVEGNFVTGPGVGILVSGLCNFGGVTGSISGVGFQSVCCSFAVGTAVAGFPCNLCIDGSAVAGSIPCDCFLGSPSVSGKSIICPKGLGAGEGEVAGPPIVVGGPFTLGDVIIDGIEIHNAMGSTGVLIEGTNLSNIQVTNSLIEADLDGVHINGDSTVAAPDQDLTNNNVLVSGNSVIGDADADGAGEAVEIGLDGNLAGKITAQVIDNPNLSSLNDDAVDMAYCSSPFALPPGDCDASESAINFHVNNNTKIHGDGDGVDMEIAATGAPVSSDRTDVDVQVNGNGLIDSDEDDGIDIEVRVCCDESFSTSKVQVNDNNDIIAFDDGVVVQNKVGCGQGNESDVEVNGNGSLEGQEGRGVDVQAIAGSRFDFCNTDVDSDENTAFVEVNDNDRIDGGSEGVSAKAQTGSSSGNGDDNLSTVHVNGNGEIAGGVDKVGVKVQPEAGSQFSSEDADENDAIVEVNDNGDISGGLRGIEIKGYSGVDDGGKDDTFEDFPDGTDGDGDDNLLQATIDGNGSITGNDGDGVLLDLQSGGHTESSARNTLLANVTNNGEIIGRGDSDGDGVEANLEVCCEPKPTPQGNLTLLIADNGDIIGRNADGIEIDVCCNINNVSILDNGSIRGNGDNGIDYKVAIWSDDDADFEEACPPECGLFSSVNNLKIQRNDIFNSENNGIEICCGAFQDPAENPGGGANLKSIISDNQIHHNRDHGIEVSSSFGLNIGPNNEIFSNGDDPQVDRGIEIDSDDLPGSIKTNLSGDDSCPDVTIDCVVFDTEADRNTITQNSIYDNAGLGIDLIGDIDQDGDGDHGIGCIGLSEFPSPNKCITEPVIQTLSGAKLVGDAPAGTHVEVFTADEDPADQLPLSNPQHGEGKTYLVTGTADDLGDWSINLPCGLGDMKVTATATNKTKDTSEFSANFTVLNIPCTPTPAPTNTTPPTNTPLPVSTPVVPTATPGIAKLCGDVNDDGLVNAVDVTLVLQFKAALIGSLVN